MHKIDWATLEYKTTEEVVGKWADGKLIYRRVALGTNLTSLIANLGNIGSYDSIVNLRVMVRSTGDNGWRPIPWLFNTLSSSDWFAGSYITNAGALVIQGGASIGSASKSLVIVEYTKP